MAQGFKKCKAPAELVHTFISILDEDIVATDLAGENLQGLIYKHGGSDGYTATAQLHECTQMHTVDIKKKDVGEGGHLRCP